jgi:predicted dehydrogenase
MTEKTQFKWGLAGYGDLSEKRIAPALRDNAKSTLTGVWGRQFARTKDFAERHQIPGAYQSLDELLKSGIDGLYICTPTASHFKYAMAVLQRGIHVIIDKPMAASADECEQLVQAAEDNNVKLAVAFYLRFHPKMQKVKQLIDEGALGKITWVNIVCNGWYNPSEDDPKFWRVQKQFSGGGGALSDIGVHRLDLLDYWLGPAKYEWSSLQHFVHSYEVEDGSSAVLSLPNGAPVHTYFAWNSKAGCDRFEICGSEGKVLLEPLTSPELTLIRNGEKEVLQFDIPENAYFEMAENFVDAVRENREPFCDGRSGARTSTLVEEILINAK